jgi:hypothetical protein
MEMGFWAGQGHGNLGEGARLQSGFWELAGSDGFLLAKGVVAVIQIA